MKLNIAFDLDATLVDLVAQLNKYLKNDGYKVKEVNSYDVTKAVSPKITKKQLWIYFARCYEEYKKTPILTGASELIGILHSKSQQPISIVTNRPIWSATDTHKLVHRFVNVPYTITFADDRFGKIAYLKDKKYFVEDRRKTAIELAAHGKKIFMLKWSWNEMPENKNIVRINQISELIKFADKFVE